EHLEENLPFIDRLVQAGVTDLAVGFYMALPGTELFQSLYTANKIEINREYFGHILHNNALVPSQSYCDQLTKRDLMFWKSRMLLRFYRAKGRLNHRAGLATSLRQAFSGFRKG